MSNNKKYWTDDEVERLWEAWKRQPADARVGTFAEDLAPGMKRSTHSIRAKTIELIRERGGMVPESQYQAFDNQPRVVGDAFVLMDAHIPFHHAEFINRCLAVCSRWGIKTMILGGDALDLHAFSKFPENFEDDNKRMIDSRLKQDLAVLTETMPAKYRMPILEKLAEAETESGNVAAEIRESRAALKAFEGAFENVVWLMGNHEQRITRILQKAIDAASLTRLFGSDNPRWEVSGYYWCELVSGGVRWQIEHPMNAGKGSSKRLVPKFGCNVIMGHNHHFSLMSDPSGQFLAVEPGMGADESRMGYASQRHNATDIHMVGASIVRDGKLTLLNRFTDWDMLEGK